jgi:hypothetical protein
MSCYIEENIKGLKLKHYVRYASSDTNYWFDFTSSKLDLYRRKHGDNFCLIIQGSKSVNDAYILPYYDVRLFFTNDLIDQRGRWIGTIKNDIIKISANGKTNSFSGSKYYNALYLLLSKESENNDIVKEPQVIKYDIEDVKLIHLKTLITEFNNKYAAVSPEKRIVISDQIARPGLITDYLKALHNHVCQICKQKGFIQRNKSLYIEAHHIMELHKLIPGSYCSDNIVVVCPTCHKKLHYANISYEIIDNSVSVIINENKSVFNRNVITE